jgi:hypothetical protein
MPFEVKYNEIHCSLYRIPFLLEQRDMKLLINCWNYKLPVNIDRFDDLFCILHLTRKLTIYQINSLKMNDEHEICPQQHPCRFSTDCV